MYQRHVKLTLTVRPMLCAMKVCVPATAGIQRLVTFVQVGTVLPAKSDSGVMSRLQSDQD